MRGSRIVLTLAFVCATGLIAANVFSGDEAPKQEGGQNAMMAMFMKMAAPGEHHKHLEPLVGSWSYAIKWRMGDGAPWTESAGTSEYKWVLGGRQLRQDALSVGEEDQPPFAGIGYLGYDNGSKKYHSVWMDTMGTGMMFSQGTCDASGKVITTVGDYFNPMTQKVHKARGVLRVINNDKHVLETHDTGADGAEFQSMEIVYTRK